MKYNKNEVTGKMRDRIILQNVTRSRSLTGFASESWSDTTTIWAYVDTKLSRSNETIIDGKNTAKNVIDFTIRYTSSISEESRIIYNSKVYQVKNIVISHDKRFITFTGFFYDSYANIIGLQLVSASLTSQSALAAALMRAVNFQANLQASASVSADINFVQKLISNLSSTGVVNALPLITKLPIASLTGTGTTAADVTVTSPATLLLDLYPNAAGAYSLRKLRAAYTGSAIRVRRSSDNTEQDIGFVNDNLDASSLTTFCGAGNGFVTIWYDQSGNAQNATMTTQANQPQIVSSGTIITHNNKYAVQYDGTNDSMNATISGMQNTTALCVFYVYSTNLAAAANTHTAILWYNGTFNSTNLRGHFSSTGLLTGEYMALDARKTSAGGERIGSTTYRRSANSIVTENTFYLTTGTSFQQNNNLISLNELSSATTSENLTPNLYNTDNNLRIGYNDFPLYANEKISELIVYLSNQTTDRSNINTNINTHYAIY